MTEPKKSTKPEKEGGLSTPTQGEVEGHSFNVHYTCWNCGAGTWVPAHWDWYVCWYCHQICIT